MDGYYSVPGYYADLEGVSCVDGSKAKYNRTAYIDEDSLYYTGYKGYVAYYMDPVCDSILVGRDLRILYSIP